ncbi:MAG TPA: type II toxin-antitoxin system HicB family antitoxin [Thioploca sp.]|nr:type II toxin-antitoxin system HicB family antitoxin [Thioploca sp.]
MELKMNTFAYPATLTPDTQNGGFEVTFVDLLEVITHGKDLADAIHQATKCLEETIAARISDNEFIPPPSPANEGHCLVHLPAQMAVKTALYNAMRNASISKTELAKRLNCEEQEINCLTDPHHVSELSSMETALLTLGHQLVIGSMPKETTLWVSMRSTHPTFFS